MNDNATPRWDDQLRANGYRVTPQRHLVFQAVAELHHGTPEEIYGHVHSQVEGVNLSTVYRTLEVLENVGLITHTHIEHGSPTYHEVQSQGHVHLVCRQCKAVNALAAEQVRPFVEALQRDPGFTVDLGHLAIHGMCAGCSETSGVAVAIRKDHTDE